MPYNKDEKSRPSIRSRCREEAPEPGAALPEPPPTEPAPPAPRSRRSLPDRAPQPAGPETVFNPDVELEPPRPGPYGPSGRRRPRPIDVAKVFYTAVLISMLILAVDYLQGGTWFLSRPRPVRSIASGQAAPAPQPFAAQPAEPQGPSALALGVKGNGVAERKLGSSTAYFELDDDGFREKTSWIAPDCAFLAQDNNGNGRIDNATELFGRQGGFPNGYAALQVLDDNGDMMISPDDAAYARLLLWQDADSDGSCDEGELKTLPEARIYFISVLHEAFPSHSFGPQPPDVLEGKVVFTDGKGGHSRDVVFRIDQMLTSYGRDVKLVPDVLFLPFLRGYGVVKDLPLAESEDPLLLALVAELVRIRNAAALYRRMDELIARWTGADAVDPRAMRGSYNARRLAVLERFTGVPFVHTQTQSTNVPPESVPHMVKSYRIMKWSNYTKLMLQTIWTREMPDAKFHLLQDEIIWPAQGRELALRLAAVVNNAAMDELPYLVEAFRFLEDGTKVPVASLAPLVKEDRRGMFEHPEAVVLPPDDPPAPAQ